MCLYVACQCLCGDHCDPITYRVADPEPRRRRLLPRWGPGYLPPLSQPACSTARLCQRQCTPGVTEALAACTVQVYLEVKINDQEDDAKPIFSGDGMEVNTSFSGSNYTIATSFNDGDEVYARVPVGDLVVEDEDFSSPIEAGEFMQPLASSVSRSIFL